MQRRATAKAPSAGADTGAGHERVRSYLRSAPAPSAAAAVAAKAELRTDAADLSVDFQNNSGVQDDDGEVRIALNFDLITVKSFFGLEFTFEIASVSPKHFHACDGGQRGAKGSFISSANSAARAFKLCTGKFVWHKPAHHVTSNDFKRWTAEDELSELESHAACAALL